VLNDRLKQKITVIAKSGANIYNNAHYYKVKNAVKKAKNPVVIVWLGTCDIPEKKGKYISVTYWMYAIRIYIPVLSIACAFRPDSLA
jgi:hypothetical protein